MINYRLKIDFLDSKTLASDICFVSGDVKSSTLYFEFYNDGKRVDVSGYTLSIRAKRSDGVVIASAGKIENNTAIFTPENNFYAVPGELYLEIALSDSTGKYVTTKIITAEVLEGLGEAAIEGTDNLNVYVKLINEAVAAKNCAEAAADVVKSVHPKVVDGIWWVYDSETGALVSTGIKAQGPKGDKGDTGEEGYSPVKGVDYYTEEEKTEILDEVLDKSSTKYANALKGNASGEIISIKDVSPVEHNLDVGVSSKNLIPYPYPQSTHTVNGVTFTDNGDGSITVNGTATAIIGFKLYQGGNLILPNTVYTLSGCINTSTSNYDLRVSDNKTTAYVCKKESGTSFSYADVSAFSIAIHIAKGLTFDNVVFKPQLEKGTVATPFTPYVPDVSKATLNVVGKNLINADEMTNAQFVKNEDGSYTFTKTADNSRFSGYANLNVSISAGTTICLSIPSWQGTTNNLEIQAHCKDDTYLTIGYLNADRKSFSHTITKEIVGFRFFFGQAVPIGEYVTIGGFQIETGKTATEYEPYIESISYPVVDGKAENVKSIYPNTTLLTDTQGVLIECEYNKDTNKAFAEMQNAIISLGGNV